jgi:hypothetical protein
MWPATAADLPPGARSGTLMETVVANTDTAMAFLVRRFQSQGGRLTQRTVRALDEAFAWYNIVVNCTGLGARELCSDPTVYAARGQVGPCPSPTSTESHKHASTYSGGSTSIHIQWREHQHTHTHTCTRVCTSTTHTDGR